MANVNELKDQIAALKAQLKEARANEPHVAPPVSLKMNERKGTVSAYGLGKFPVSLYPDQWRRLFEKQAEIVEACNKAQPVAEAFRALPADQQEAIRAEEKAAYAAKQAAKAAKE